MNKHVRADGRIRGKFFPPGRGAAKLRPRLIPIADGYHYAGVGRSTFYTRFLPRVKSVRVGRRHLIELDSLDLLIDDLHAEAAAFGAPRALNSLTEDAADYEGRSHRRAKREVDTAGGGASRANASTASSTAQYERPRTEGVRRG
jgi:hypothetical protein